MRVRLSLLILVLPFLQVSNACDCKALSPLTIVECQRFDAIVKCKIDSVSGCDKRSIAYAHALEIYKGEQTELLQLNFDCSTNCQLSFAKDEVWLIYGIKNEANQYMLNFCDRNRKYFANAKEDYYTTNTGLSFEQELTYLKKNIGLKIKASTVSSNQSIDITQRQNDQTTGGNKLLLLFVSLLLFLLIYFLVNKKIK